MVIQIWIPFFIIDDKLYLIKSISSCRLSYSKVFCDFSMGYYGNKIAFSVTFSYAWQMEII